MSLRCSPGGDPEDRPPGRRDLLRSPDGPSVRPVSSGPEPAERSAHAGSGEYAAEALRPHSFLRDTLPAIGASWCLPDRQSGLSCLLEEIWNETNLLPDDPLVFAEIRQAQRC